MGGETSSKFKTRICIIIATNYNIRLAHAGVHGGGNLRCDSNRLSKKYLRKKGQLTAIFLID